MGLSEGIKMKEKSNKTSFYIKILILIIVVILGYFFIPFKQNNFGNAYKVRSIPVSADPIKLQFRNGFQHDTYKPNKKTTFMQKRMENEKDKKPLFWDKK
jgi:amino acid transporter